MNPRVTVLTGHYGSGKSEVTVNLAMQAVTQFSSVALIDLDVINPYFRSREKRILLEAAGIQVIANNLEIDTGIDIPAVSAQMFAPLQDAKFRTFVDSGGDAAGARLLGTTSNYLRNPDVEILCVCNASRPDTRTAQGVLRHIRSIESVSGLQITGLINNTHMLEHTEIQHILQGNQLCREVTELTGLPLRYTSVPQFLIEELKGSLPGEILPIAMFLRESWMYEGEGYGKS